MEKFDELAVRLAQNKPPEWADFPDIDLYIDQVLIYLSRYQITQREDEKLTSAMVNNYIKEGMIPRSNDKKYSKEHLAYLNIVSRLKQVLSVKDTASLVKSCFGTDEIEKRYAEFNVIFSDYLDTLTDYLKNEGKVNNKAELAVCLAVSAYLSKIACEYLLDQINSETEQNNTHDENEKDKKSKDKDKKDKDKEKIKKEKKNKENKD